MYLLPHSLYSDQTRGSEEASFEFWAWAGEIQNREQEDSEAFEGRRTESCRLGTAAWAHAEGKVIFCGECNSTGINRNSIIYDCINKSIY